MESVSFLRKAMNAKPNSVSLARLHEEERTLVTAHRGNSLEYPENTLLAMEKAVESGADFIEFDLRSTRHSVLAFGYAHGDAAHEFGALGVLLK